MGSLLHRVAPGKMVVQALCHVVRHAAMEFWVLTRWGVICSRVGVVLVVECTGTISQLRGDVVRPFPCRPIDM